MARLFSYPATLTRDDAGYHLVSFPDFPEAHTDGKTLTEALAEAADCLEEAIAGRIARAEDIPAPSAAGDYAIPVPAPAAAKAALYLAMRESGVSKSELARRMGCDEKEARRLLDPRHPSKIERIEDALHALGKTLVLEMRDAA